MHEWSLAGAVVNSLLSFAREEGVSSFREVELTFGEVMELNREIFRTAFKELSRGTPLEGARLVIRLEPAIFRCNACGHTWNFEEAHRMLSHELGILEEPSGDRESPLHFLPDLARALLKCPSCGSRDFELVSGKDLRISRVVVSG